MIEKRGKRCECGRRFNPARAGPGFFQIGGCKNESSRQTSRGQGVGEGELEGNV